MKKKNCNCRSYTFPHRMFSGDCLANEQGPFCGLCGKPCDVHWNDEGIGHYEFFGQVGYDSSMAAESECCNYNVFSDPELTEEYIE